MSLRASADVVVLEEDDAPLGSRVARELDDRLHDVLARRVLRVRLARDDDLHRQRQQPLEVGEDEPGALVGREAPREADRQALRVEPGPLHDTAATLLVHVPERLRVEIGDGVPVRLVGRCFGADARLAEEVYESGIEPRTEMHAVRDMPDRRRAAVTVGPEPRPHLARDLAVQRRDTVRVARRAVTRTASGRSRRRRRNGRARAAPRTVDAGGLGQPATYRSTSSSPKTSFPAGTGVCVVKIVVRRTCSTASPVETPCSTSARSRSIARNAEWPSFMWNTLGSTPSAASARTPPTPSRSSWRIRCSRSPP